MVTAPKKDYVVGRIVNPSYIANNPFYGYLHSQ